MQKMNAVFDKLILKKLVWVGYLALALVFVQAAQLHLHSYAAHDLAMTDHLHQDQMYLKHDASEVAHLDEVAEVDLSQQGFLKKLSSNVLIVALFLVLTIVSSFGIMSRLPWRYSRGSPISSWLYSLQPPLRAPPAK